MSYEKTRCPKCGKDFRFKTEHLGKRTRCKSCNEVIVIARIDPEQETQSPPTVAEARSPDLVKPVPVAEAQPKPAKMLTAKPVEPPVATAKTPVATPAPPQPTESQGKESASPYESFVDEVMTGVGSTVQKVAALPTGTAESYLKTNSKLNFGKPKRDGDWATTFIFRGTNLAFFGFLLFGISMIGFSVAGFGSLLMPLTSPLCALIALTVGICGSVMVMVGFAAKPGSAALCGLVPTLLFIAGGIWLGSRYFDGHWDIDSKTMAKVADHHRDAPARHKFNQNPIARKQAIPPDHAIPKIDRHLDSDPFKDAQEIQQRMMERSRKRIEEQNRKARERAERAMEEAQRGVRNDPFEFEKNNPEAKNERDQNNRRRVEPSKTVKPAPAKDTPDPFAGWSNSGASDQPGKKPTGDRENSNTSSIPFANYQNTYSKAMRARSEMERNARNRFGMSSMLSFPPANLIGRLGESSQQRRHGTAMISSPASPVIGFLAIGTHNGSECRQLTPVYDTQETSSSVAKEGYVLAGLEAGFRNQKLTVVRGIYMKRSGKQVDPQDRYEGEWVGISADIETATSIESDGAIPIGIRFTGIASVQTVSLIIE